MSTTHPIGFTRPRERQGPASTTPIIGRSVDIRRCCLVVTDQAPSDGALPTALLDGRNPTTWRFHVVVTARSVPGWSNALAAADPLSGWVLAANVDQPDPVELRRQRGDALATWLTSLNSTGFRALGTSSDDGAWLASVDLLDDRRFDEVVVINADRGIAGPLARIADRLLAWRLHRRFELPASMVRLS
jgi:hypothetical protein